MYGNNDPEHERFMDEHERERVNFIHECERKSAAPVQKPIEHLIAAFRALAPHCTMHDIARFREVCRNVLAVPPAAQRQWVGLTDEEWVNALGKVREQLNGDVFGGFYRAIEAKLKEKNT